jgi:hypothetical protein
VASGETSQIDFTRLRNALAIESDIEIIATNDAVDVEEDELWSSYGASFRSVNASVTDSISVPHNAAVKCVTSSALTAAIARGLAID